MQIERERASSEKKLMFDFREVWCFFFSLLPPAPAPYTKSKLEQIFCVESIIFKRLPAVPHKNDADKLHAKAKSVQLTAASGISTFKKKKKTIKKIKTLHNF